MSKSKSPQPETDRTIILLRHGIAEDKAADGKDESRRLTAQGRARMKEVAGGLAGLFPKLDAIYTSPLIRAVQTAQAVARAYGKNVKINTADELAPGGGVKKFRELLGQHAHRRAIFVGHEPDLTATLFGLLGIRGAKGRVELKKGGCYVVTLGADGTVALDHVLAPRVLRKL